MEQPPKKPNYFYKIIRLILISIISFSIRNILYYYSIDVIREPYNIISVIYFLFVLSMIELNKNYENNKFNKRYFGINKEFFIKVLFKFSFIYLSRFIFIEFFSESFYSFLCNHNYIERFIQNHNYLINIFIHNLGILLWGSDKILIPLQGLRPEGLNNKINNINNGISKMNIDRLLNSLSANQLQQLNRLRQDNLELKLEKAERLGRKNVNPKLSRQENLELFISQNAKLRWEINELSKRRFAELKRQQIYSVESLRQRQSVSADEWARQQLADKQLKLHNLTRFNTWTQQNGLYNGIDIKKLPKIHKKWLANLIHPGEYFMRHSGEQAWPEENVLKVRRLEDGSYSGTSFANMVQFHHRFFKKSFIYLTNEVISRDPELKKWFLDTLKIINSNQYAVVLGGRDHKGWSLEEIADFEIEKIKINRKFIDQFNYK